ncbi:MAG TPA: HD domain-containing protein, partial [Candidatus Bathyarchaeia archaeon]
MEELVNFWKLAARLKEEARRGWVQRLHLKDVESVADHSYGLAMLSLYEAYRRGYDVEKVLKLALVHDLEEAITGDLTPLDKRRKGADGTFRLRRSALRQVLSKFPAEGRRDYRELWTDLRKGRSR